MTFDLLITVATLASLVWTGGAAIALVTDDRANMRWNLVYVITSFTVLAGTVWMAWLISPGRNHLTYVWQLLNGRDPYQFCSAAMGACIGLVLAPWPWQARWGERPQGWSSACIKLIGLLSACGIFFFLGVLVLNEKIQPYLRHRGLTDVLSDSSLSSLPSGFVMEEFHKCENRPIQLAINDDGVVFYCYMSKNGGVARIDEDRAAGTVSEREIAWNIDRPFGLAFYNNDLYISRSGRHTRAEGGELVEVPTGAVTLVKDLNGDHIMDLYQDVLADLPGQQGPDPLHQNNGITFDADGNLFVTVGAHSNRSPVTGELEGTIIRARHDGSERMVFARGLRNPFDLVFGPDGELFCTDNDIGFGDSEELNHIVEGGHYGHPYVKGNEQHPPEYRAPIWVYGSSTLQGIAYTDSEQLPAEYRHCLYVVSHGSGEIHRIKLHRKGDTYRAESSVFARIPEALDVAITDEGTFYVSCFMDHKIHRLSYAGVND